MLRALVLGSVRPTLRQFTSSCTCLAGKTWRESKGLSRSGNEYGPLTDLPDWSFADGRPAPPKTNELRRKEEQRQLAERIDILSKELLQAKEKHKAKLEAERRENLRIAERRLRQKGSYWKQDDYVEKRSKKSPRKQTSNS